MSAPVQLSETVSVSLSPDQCRTLLRLGRCFLESDVDAEGFLEKLGEAEALSMWLRDIVRLELTPQEVVLLRSLQQRVTGKPISQLSFNSMVDMASSV